MSRARIVGFLIPLLLLSVPTSGFGQPGEPSVAGGSVSVELAGATPTVTFEAFHAGLRPYGEWVERPPYGPVWRPRLALGWRPYYYGSWVWSDEGWYWDSEEPFAWAVYHYGRWVFDPVLGWLWVPGYEWAPAWVTWRFGGGVVGWAPLAPGISVYVTAYPFVDYWWTFVPTVRFVGVPVPAVAYGPRETHRWYRTTAPAPPRLAPPHPGARHAPSPAWGGPSRSVVEERTGRPVPSVRAVPSRGPGDPAPRALPPAPRPGPPAGPAGRQDAPPARERWERGGDRGGDGAPDGWSPRAQRPEPPRAGPAPGRPEAGRGPTPSRDGTPRASRGGEDRPAPKGKGAEQDRQRR